METRKCPENPFGGQSGLFGAKLKTTHVNIPKTCTKCWVKVKIALKHFGELYGMSRAQLRITLQ